MRRDEPATCIAKKEGTLFFQKMEGRRQPQTGTLTAPLPPTAGLSLRPPCPLGALTAPAGMIFLLWTERDAMPTPSKRVMPAAGGSAGQRQGRHLVATLHTSTISCLSRPPPFTQKA